MSDTDQISNPAVEDPAPAPRKRFDAGFKRNMYIIGGAVAIGVVITAVIALTAKSRIDSSKSQPANSSITGGTTFGGSTPTTLTPADEARLGRVQTKESEVAGEKKDTYIPRDMVDKVEAVQPPPSSTNGPGVGYSINAGDRSGQTVDPQREALIRKGIEEQLGKLVAKLEPPVTQQAAAYQSPQQAANGQQSVGSVVPVSTTVPPTTTVSFAGAVLIRGLGLAGARLVSPCDTEKTAFVTSEINTGPLTGAYLVGQCRLVGEEGVQVTFSRMTFGGESYAVNVTALDNATSSDAVAANVDRKLLSRYVFPVVFTTLQAYLGALARPAQAVIANANTQAQVVTPAATAREAVATGVASGIGKAGEALATAKASAFMPIDTPLALLFNEPVFKKEIK